MDRLTPDQDEAVMRAVQDSAPRLAATDLVGVHLGPAEIQRYGLEPLLGKLEKEIYEATVIDGDGSVFTAGGSVVSAENRAAQGGLAWSMENTPVKAALMIEGKERSRLELSPHAVQGLSGALLGRRSADLHARNKNAATFARLGPFDRVTAGWEEEQAAALYRAAGRAAAVLFTIGNEGIVGYTGSVAEIPQYKLEGDKLDGEVSTVAAHLSLLQGRPGIHTYVSDGQVWVIHDPTSETGTEIRDDSSNWIPIAGGGRRLRSSVFEQLQSAGRVVAAARIGKDSFTTLHEGHALRPDDPDFTASSFVLASRGTQVKGDVVRPTRGDVMVVARDLFHKAVQLAQVPVARSFLGYLRNRRYRTRVEK